MTTGAGIFLLAVGAILSFAVTDRISGVDLRMIGYILMAAGAVGLLIGLVGRRTSTTVQHTDPAGGVSTTRREDNISGT